jgi:RHS repeat-associated protein
MNIFKIISIVAIALLPEVLLAQTINGPSQVCAGTTVNYSVTGLLREIMWGVQGGTLLSDPADGSATVQWGSSGGRVTVSGEKDKWGTPGSAYFTVRIMSGGVVTIGASSSLASSMTEEATSKEMDLAATETVTMENVGHIQVVTVCGASSYSGVLTLSNFSGPILRWEYRHDATNWQTISHNSSTYSFSANRTTFYRAVVGNAYCQLYSQTATLYFPNIPAPAVTSTPRCGEGKLRLEAYVKDAESYKWYPSVNTGELLATTATYEPYLTQSKPLWVSAVIGGCEGPRAYTLAVVNPLPPLPDVSINRRYECSQTVVSLAVVAPQGQTYYWQDTNVREQFNDRSPTTQPKTVFGPGSAYMNARYNDTGCFGAVESYPVTVYVQAPKPPVPEIKSEDCVSTTLEASMPEVPRVVYYWQTEPYGRSTTNAAQFLTATQSGKYYLRGNFIDGDCWGVSSPATVTIKRNACIEAQQKNFVVTNTILREGVRAPSEVSYLPVASNAVTVAYADGFGRTSQEVKFQGSPSGKDMVQIMAYDALGRENKKYLPFSSLASAGQYQDNAMNAQTIFYDEPYASAGRYAGTTTPWQETLFEASPLSKVKEKGAAGEPWQIGGRTVRNKLHFNAASQVRRWQYNFSTGEIYSNDFYGAAQLTIEETADENNFRTWTFKDKQGRVVYIRREISPYDHAPTSFVFDSFSRLRAVIQPEGARQLPPAEPTTLDASFIDRWCFTYKYDRFGRVAEKKIPGAAPVYSVYNKRNQVILTQDGEQRKRREWSFIKYDEFRRAVMTGIYTHQAEVSQAEMQSAADTHEGVFEIRSKDSDARYGYSLSRSFPALTSANPAIHIVNYYDDYNFDFDKATADPAYITSGLSPEPVPVSQVTNKVTGMRISVPSTGQMLLTVNFYDKRGGVIQTQKDNHLGGKDIVTRQLDFTGNVLEDLYKHQTSAATVTVRKFMTYDHAGRMLTVKQKINNDLVVTLVSYTYNELGQVVEKKLHSTDGSNFLQKLDYGYTIRGWLSKINDPSLSEPSDLFGMNLVYNEPARMNNIPRQFNGNVAELVYNDRLLNKTRGYGYTYDGVAQLKSAAYKAWNAAGVPQEENAYNEEGIAYDMNGNIRYMARNNPEGNKTLDYTYSGNRLTGIVRSGSLSGDDPERDHPAPDGPEESLASPSGNGETNASANATVTGQYQYDANGNLTADIGRGIVSVTYNHMNLPVAIVIPGKGEIRYSYDASGTRLAKHVTDSTGSTQSRNYVGGIEYNAAMKIELMATEEGRVVMTGATPEYQYYLKDHLGNVRVTFTSAPTTITSTATLESASAGDEQSKFLYYDEAVKVNYALFDHSRKGTTRYAARLNGSAKERVGLARSISVMPGDVVKMQVFAKYLDTDRSNWSSALTSFMTSVATGSVPAGTIVDGGAAGSIGNASFPLGQWLDKSTSAGAGPKAYLNYVVFDRNFRYTDGGYVRVTENARETGAGTDHEQLAKEITITTPGYVYVYLSNENETPVDVYFDDFSVALVQSLIVGGEEYYPFGSTFNSYTRENSTEQHYLFGGKERQTELGLHWDDFGARMYDPETGRWNSSDPLADKYSDISPYAYVANNPLKYRDPDGKEIWISINPRLQVQYRTGQLYYADGSLYVGNDRFARTVSGFLGLLSKMDPMLTHRLHALESSKLKHVITSTIGITRAMNVKNEINLVDENSTLYGSSSMPMSLYSQKLKKEQNENKSLGYVNLPDGTFVHFDMNKHYSIDDDLELGEPRLPIGVLAHELLGHSYQTQEGGVERERRLVNEGTPDERQLSMSEVDAVNIENIVKYYMGQILKGEYGRVTIPTDYLFPQHQGGPFWTEPIRP